MTKSWKDIEEEKQCQRHQEIEAEKRKAFAARRDWLSAAQIARQSVRQNGLLPDCDESGSYRYTVRQGLKAACQAREDIVATLMLQLDILKRLDRNYILLWVVIALLLYVAYRVS